MKVKMLHSWWSDKRLENYINEFLDELEHEEFEVVEIQYRPTIWGYFATVVYQ